MLTRSGNYLLNATTKINILHNALVYLKNYSSGLRLLIMVVAARTVTKTRTGLELDGIGLELDWGFRYLLKFSGFV